jgi:hypothetical protein
LLSLYFFHYFWLRDNKLLAVAFLWLDSHSLKSLYLGFLIHHVLLEDVNQLLFLSDFAVF